ncbi:helix-turn-helix domain-containing protein [Salmonella enterica subsp. enterica serovar Morehead]|nr:helix-turn-helix domain-containing protein [Salmonella enterica subsp. enterica serovar Morehead]
MRSANRVKVRFIQQSPTEIARQLNISRSTVYKILKDEKVE